MQPLRKADTRTKRTIRKAKPTGERFDAPVAAEQAAALYPKVMAKLAE